MTDSADEFSACQDARDGVTAESDDTALENAQGIASANSALLATAETSANAELTEAEGKKPDLTTKKEAAEAAQG